ncbi:MAG: DUF1638 domain-containing protein [Pseudomonadota bacterium]
MHTVVLACNTIRGELEKAVRETGCRFPFKWVESGLHLKPESLRRRLQEELDCIDNADRVLLGFGYCGHAADGLTSGNFELIIPRVDDCISLLLGSRENRDRGVGSGKTYFLTKGWLEGESNIWTEYRAVLSRFGPQNTERIYKRMLAHYEYLGLIDTGAYELEAMLPVVNEIAATLHLKTSVLPGSDLYLKRLLVGPWDEEDFVVVTRHTRVDLFRWGPDFSPRSPQIQSVL